MAGGVRERESDQLCLSLFGRSLLPLYNNDRRDSSSRGAVTVAKTMTTVTKPIEP